MSPVASPCTNLNHRRSNAPVRFCPSCGDVVNANVRPKRCLDSQHDVQRRNQSTFCIHCGQRLVDASRA
jgi:hypothetical protein